jgi:two-component system, cell cycle sensor histidine kinase and response regulator CckA
MKTSASRLLRFSTTDAQRWVLFGTGVGALGYMILVLTQFAQPTLLSAAHAGGLLFAASACAVGWLLARASHTYEGGVVALLGVWMEVHVSLAQTHQFPSPSLLGSSTVVAISALLFSTRVSAFFAIGSGVLTWILVLLSPAMRETGMTPEAFYWLAVHGVTTFAVWGLLLLAFSSIDGAFADVTQKERELSEMIARSPDGILVLNAEDVVLAANPAAATMIGTPLDDCIGEPLLTVLPTMSPGDVAQPLPLDECGENPRAFALLRRDETRVELEVTWRSLERGRRQLVLRDVTEYVRAEVARRTMESRLAHAQRLEAVGQLAGGIAHDFNNILTIVGASAQLLKLELKASPSTPLIDEILAAQDRGATLTRQLLAFARREVVNPRVFDVSKQVSALQALLARVAGEQVRLVYELEAGCRILADVGQVEQALVNLVSNARDAMPLGGVCNLGVVRMINDNGDHWVRLRVADQGIGMDATTRARAFEPFFTTKPRGRGTGLGLASVHGMVMQSGGRTDIESAPGKGTTVFLEFPYSAEPSTEIDVVRAMSAMPSDATILLAEDDAGTRVAVARMLEQLGYTVLLAADGSEALAVANEHGDAIDLVLTDVIMPGMSGPEMIAILRQQLPLVPVLFMSGYPEDALAAVDGYRHERDFLAKPFTRETLAQRISDKLSVPVSSRGTVGGVFQN